MHQHLLVFSIPIASFSALIWTPALTRAWSDTLWSCVNGIFYFEYTNDAGTHLFSSLVPIEFAHIRDEEDWLHQHTNAESCPQSCWRDERSFTESSSTSRRRGRGPVFRSLVLTYDAHFCWKHQGHTDGEADEVESYQVAQSTDQLFPCSSENASSDRLWTSNTG